MTDTVIGCTLVIKTLWGCNYDRVIGICLIPIVEMFAIILIYKMTCVLLEPLAEGRIIKCVSEVASSMTYILGTVVSVAFMFLITITVLIMASNISVMVR